ncbi:hypothetical protein VP01_1656g1 [Puccinia sorghi]|uniref:Uncharacterized protein n=1 Tax=Puccinia sorghi TaxID=27349 RepID=A0A0L6VGY5_9BASI|nr:hypothetical protein VP01_1656g1 [Puccinia sorghi]
MAISVTTTSEERWQRRKVEDNSGLQKHTIGLNETTSNIRKNICCQHVRYQLLHLYPTVKILIPLNTPSRRRSLQLDTPWKPIFSCCTVEDLLLPIQKTAIDHEGKGQLEVLIHFSPWLTRVYQSGGFLKPFLGWGDVVYWLEESPRVPQSCGKIYQKIQGLSTREVLKTKEIDKNH